MYHFQKPIPNHSSCGSKVVVVESDCRQIVRMLQAKEGDDDSYLGVIVRESLSIACSFDVISFHHVFR